MTEYTGGLASAYVIIVTSWTFTFGIITVKLYMALIVLAHITAATIPLLSSNQPLNGART